MAFKLPDEIPLKVAAATANYLDDLQAAGTFGVSCEVRWSFGDFAERWDKMPADTSYVDVVPPVVPVVTRTGRPAYTWGDELRIGVRAKVGRMQDANGWDGRIDPYKLVTYVGVLYKIHEHFKISLSNTGGRSLTDFPHAILGDNERRQLEFLSFWDPDLLLKGIYQGILSVPWRVTEIPA